MHVVILLKWKRLRNNTYYMNISVSSGKTPTLTPRIRVARRDMSTDSVNGSVAPLASDAGSLDDYISADTPRFNEDGSFIGIK